MTDLAPILLVEDSPDDRVAVVRALRRAGIRHPIEECEDGDEALDYLYQRGSFASAVRPSFVILDLNMPRVNGVDVVAELKGNPNLRKIPVVILTTSADERDINRSYDAGANGYVQKPVGRDGFVEAIDRLARFWFDVALLPIDRDGNGGHRTGTS